jgi:hypothetical protein
LKSAEAAFAGFHRFKGCHPYWQHMSQSTAVLIALNLILMMMTTKVFYCKVYQMFGTWCSYLMTPK